MCILECIMSRIHNSYPFTHSPIIAATIGTLLQPPRTTYCTSTNITSIEFARNTTAILLVTSNQRFENRVFGIRDAMCHIPASIYLHDLCELELACAFDLTMTDIGLVMTPQSVIVYQLMKNCGFSSASFQVKLFVV